jgi:putative SOS response-associated peptidase YedK
MCGRYSITTPVEAMRELFDFTGRPPNLPPRYNVAPTQDAPVIRMRDGDRELAMLRWGLVPSWSQGPDSRFSMINARAETVANKPAFRAAFRARRCLVPADGFYEWTPAKGGKQPYRITLKDGGLFALAGLWEHWAGKDETIDSFTIVVTEANELLAPIHDRMPVILAPDEYEAWLRGEPRDAAALLDPYPAGELTAYPVSKHVNSPRNDDPECVAPL